MTRKLSALLALLLFPILACTRASVPPPTPNPATVAMEQTNIAALSLLLSAGLTETAQASPATSTPAFTPEPSATIFEDEAIFIIEPGSGAIVTSPVRVAGEADPTFEQSLVVQIADESGAVIATAPAQIAADLGHRGPFVVDVSFTVAAEGPGRISVFAVSARDGGLTHLSSVEVILKP
ncbi:MAG: Gmad2 immunoglobulin-like domain-containing protein [Chloroflexi bacterium]|nr:Gmad2 immunoglobulin-like domain-containing protein [Chloroflexota bacterium]